MVCPILFSSHTLSLPKNKTLMGNKIRRADALREMETREKSTGRASHFSVQFYLKNGELVSFARAVVRGLKADMKSNRLRGIQPVDSQGKPIGHIHTVSIDNLREFNGKQVVI